MGEFYLGESSIIEITEEDLLHILRCALFMHSHLSPGADNHDLPPFLREQLSPSGQAQLDKWLSEAP